MSETRVKPRFELPPDDRTLEQALDDRIAGLADWIRERAPYCAEEQAHLERDTCEQAYWHHGYLLALRDVRDFIKRKRRTLN